MQRGAGRCLTLIVEGEPKELHETRLKTSGRDRLGHELLLNPLQERSPFDGMSGNASGRR